MDPDRFLAPDPGQRRVAHELYDAIADLPLVCPHDHVDPRLLADEKATFGTPADLFIIPDHYVFRMLYSQGVPLDALSKAVGREITTAKGLIRALEERREFFKSMGATATDSGVETPYTEALSSKKAEAIFGLAGLVMRGLLDMADAAEVAPDMTNGLARRTYKL